MKTPVNYLGCFQDSTGYGSAARAFVTALYVAGVEVTTELAVHTIDRGDLGWEAHLCHKLADRDISYKVKILHVTPDIYENYLEKRKYHIGHLFWETNRLPKEWVDACNRVQEIWTSSPNMADVFRESGVTVPIHSFPQPIDTSWSWKRMEKFQLVGHNGFLFYSIFQWIERKNPKGLLTTFWKTFEGRDDVSLLLKVFRLSYKDTEFEKIRDDIRTWKKELGLSHYPKVYLCTEHMSTNRIMRLHLTGDCYVQPDHGEGWSRTVQEALLMQKPVIATARGGIHEYLKHEHYFRIPSTYVGVKETPWIKFYRRDQQWAEPDLHEFSKAMKFVQQDAALATAKGVVGQRFIEDAFSYQTIGEMMKKRLEEIYQKL